MPGVPIPLLISTFSEVCSPLQSENTLGSEQSDTPYYPANLRSLDEISDAPPEKRSCKCMRAMKMELAFVDWLRDKETVDHHNYHFLFKEGALEPLM
jgi:hypothetical protein